MFFYLTVQTILDVVDYEQISVFVYLPNKGRIATGISEVMANGSASVTQKVAIINITYAHLKACKKIKERAFRLNTWLSELRDEG